MRPTSGPGEEDLDASAPATDDTTVPALLTFEAMQAATPHQHLEGCALVLRSDAATDRTGHTYLSLTLRGADGGNIEARWWRYPYPFEQRPAAGQICWFTGDLDAYHGEPQLRVDQARPAPNLKRTSLCAPHAGTLKICAANLPPSSMRSSRISRPLSARYSAARCMSASASGPHPSSGTAQCDTVCSRTRFASPRLPETSPPPTAPRAYPTIAI
jgi:hypothetical protein